MGILNYIKQKFAKTQQEEKKVDEFEPFMIDMPILDIELAKSEGSIISSIETYQRIKSYGNFNLFGVSVKNYYLNDEKSFVRVTNDNEMTLFVLRDEIEPETKEDWEFWLGSWDAKKNAYDIGLIGNDQFQITLDNGTELVYDKVWSSDTILINEILESEPGKSYIKRNGAEYVRNIGSNYEYLFVNMKQEADNSTIEIYVGIRLNIKDVKFIK